MTTTSVPDLSGRRAPAFGGYNLTALNLEIRRLRRNPRAVIITVIVPIIFYFAFGLNRVNTTGNYGHGNYAAWVLVSLALYGAIFSTTYTGAGVSVERAQGWSRQLRLTPLSSAGYIGMKVTTALVLGLVPITIVNVVGGILTHKAQMPVYLWIVSALCVWAGSLLFAAFGLFIGFLIPADVVPQLLGLIMSLFAFVGGLFIPIDILPQSIQDIAKWSPEYGINQLVHAPLLGGGVQWTWIVNVIAWLVIFAGGAIWRFGKDTARV
ncbi:MAG TPA: ABC transporter permease [Streptosporangiaceae bacterium]|jgi:ABC-2 type transport system permease protein|nr:ABC transporter permease [Streptosporangiaceae bacterium]